MNSKMIPKGRFAAPTTCYACKGKCVDECPMCYGRKVFNGKKCQECDGKGVVRCYACGGTGKLD